MLSRTMVCRGGPWVEGRPNFERAAQRRKTLERRRLSDSRTMTPPIEPTAEQARSLYRKLLKLSKTQLVYTDLGYFRRKVRAEFEVTSRQTSSRVRGIMYEKGCWMVENRLGGLL